MRANKENRSSFAKNTVKAIAITLAVIAFFALMTLAGLVIFVNSDTEVDVDALALKNSVPEVYDAYSRPASYYLAGEITTDYDSVPQHLKDAFVALEDKRFYDHHGIDYIRILGAFAANVKSGSRAQGGSTITQQIVKNAFLSGEKSFSRKLKEARLAVSLERRLSKDEILETYLNMLYFGSGEYGVKNAARRFFGCEVSELSVAQSAMLAGIVKSPTKYNPINNYDNALSRSRLVLSLMLEQGKITETQYNEALTENIVIADDRSEEFFDKTYVVNAVSEASAILGIDEKELRAKGYAIYTFLDPEKQEKIKNTVSDDSFYSDGNALCAAIDCDTESGGISAVYSNFSLDLANFRRQAGSVLKPLVCYTPAFDCGALSPASVLDDEPTDFGGYSPENYGKKYYGKISARDALAYSLNVPAVSVLTTIGVQSGYDTLRKAGFSLGDDDNLSLALGSTLNGCSFKELLGGYLTLARGGNYTPATFVREIRDADGNVVYSCKNNVENRVFSQESVYLTTNCLQKCAQSGTAKKLSSLGFDVASKTGTVASGNGNVDAYNISYTTSDCVLFWQGSARYDAPLSSTVTGGGQPTLMCKNYLASIYENEKPAAFTVPQSITEVRLDKVAYDEGRLVTASDNAPSIFVVSDIFDARYLPSERDTSFDYPSAGAFEAKTLGDEVTITFTADSHLCYKVIKKSLFTDDRIVSEVKNRSGTITVEDTADGIFGYNRYVVVPYYIDDDGRETIGEIYQIPVGW